MATIIESAKTYESKQTLNIEDVSEVDVNLELQDRSGKKISDKGDEETFNYQVAIIDEKEYRVPATVLEKLQEALKIKSDIKKIKVNKAGSGFNTKYSIEVIE